MVISGESRADLGPISGRSRPQVRRTAEAASDSVSLEEVLVVMKWGGELTSLGQQEAEELGRTLRHRVSSPEGPDSLLHLHSTYRHDLKLYASDEGRVQMTAAACAKGMLELAGELAPILTSLVRKDASANQMLDDTSGASASLSAVKKRSLQPPSRAHSAPVVA